MHDAAEAYIGDLIRPLKVHVKFDHYRFIETRLESVIAKRFKLEYDHDKFLWPQEVLDVDEDMALTETDQIIKMNDGHPTNNQLNTGKKLLPIKIMMREPWAAMQLFLNRCDDLGLM